MNQQRYNQDLERRVAALEAQFQRLPKDSTRLSNFICIIIGVALSDLIADPLINLIFGLLQK